MSEKKNIKPLYCSYFGFHETHCNRPITSVWWLCSVKSLPFSTDHNTSL